MAHGACDFIYCVIYIVQWVYCLLCGAKSFIARKDRGSARVVSTSMDTQHMFLFYCIDMYVVLPRIIESNRYYPVRVIYSYQCIWNLGLYLEATATALVPSFVMQGTLPFMLV